MYLFPEQVCNLSVKINTRLTYNYHAMLQSSLLRRFSCVLRWREEQTPVMPQGMPGDPMVSLSGHHRLKGGTSLNNYSTRACS